MVRVKIVSRFLFYVSRLLAFLYLATVLYAGICLVTGMKLEAYGEGRFLHIKYPFSSSNFLNVDNNTPYLLFSFLLPLLLYGIFFWLSSDLFRIFFQPRLFTKTNIVALRRFYLFNLIAPVLASAIASFYVEVENFLWLLVIVHVFFGIFTYFLAAIFKQGMNLQTEQDLFI